jgi:hypothetical protein
MMHPKDLCLKLAQSESEEEVITILKQENLWSDSENWKLFGDDENNYSTIGNQQSRPESAIVEKLINSVDAILMAECLKLGVKPDSDQSPRSIKEALIRFFKITDGKLSNLTSRERSLIAENILFVATGTKSNPTFTVIDKGEGQTPAKMPDTILSIKKSNKLKIPFVQGKFNMGGTGVFRFCGENNIQIVVSKRHPIIAQNESDPTKNLWGFTVIRRENPILGARSSNYKYLAPSGHLFFFESESLPLLPSQYPNAYGNPLEWGTFIKFFEYKIGPGLKTNILFDLYNKLSLLMPNVALPIKFYERRKGYTGHSFETTLAGLSVRVEEDRSEIIEDGFPTSGILTADSQRMTYSIYVFKKEKGEKFTKDEGIIFTINGQTHGYLSKAFFSRNKVGLNYLSDSILVILDCSEIDGRSREDLFMNSRDRLSNPPLRNVIESQLEETLKNHPGLRQLKEKRTREDIEGRLQNSKPLVDVIKDVLKNSPTLSRLFIQGMALQNPFKIISAAKQENYTGKHFPTFFTLIKKFSPESPKQAHLNSKFRIEFKTDATNDFFRRDRDQGEFTLFINEAESSRGSINLWNGFAYLNISTDGFSLGDSLHCRVEINDVSRHLPLKETFSINVIGPLSVGSSNGASRKPPSSNTEGEDSFANDGFSIPQIIEVGKNDWVQHNFTERSALKVKGNPEDGFNFFINIDNIHLLSEMKQVGARNPQVLQAKYKFGQVLVGLALLNYKSASEGEEEDEGNVYDLIQKTSSALSPIIIPMIESLSSIDGDKLATISEEIN